MVNLTALCAVAALAWFGGWEWALVFAASILVLRREDWNFTAVIALTVPGVLWLTLALWTGDRRLFFPYAMQHATQLGCLYTGRKLWAAFTAAAAMVALFLLIRVGQAASAEVLAVETAVAAAVLGLTLGLCAKLSPGPVARAVIGGAASALAFAGLFV